MSSSNKLPLADYRLKNINNALYVDSNDDVVMRTGFAGNIVISGNVNVPGTIAVDSTPENPVHVHLTELGTFGNLTTFVPVRGNVAVDNFPTNVQITDGSVSVTNFPSNIRITDMPGVSGNVHIWGNIGGADQPITVNQGTTPWTVAGNVTATLTSNATVGFSATNLDAFGRLRMSNPYTLFDSALKYTPKNHFSNAVSTGGTVTFDFNASVRNLTVTNASGSQVVRESRRVFNYQPGKSLLILLSFIMAGAKANLRQRVGYFGAANGIYFEQDGTQLNMVIRSSSSGSMIEERIPQSSWNGDRLDGTGASGITLDTSATQIWFCDIEWLGVGTVRTGFIINGQFVVAHRFNHANNPTYTTTYMGTAILPIRYEITNTGSTSGSSTMKQICCTVISEGGYNETGPTEVAGTGVSIVRLRTAGTFYPVASIRLNSARLDSVVRINQVDILSPSVNYYQWKLLKNPTLTGATWAGYSSTGNVDWDTAATAVSGGTVTASGYADARTAITLDPSVFQIFLGRDQAGVSDVYTLALSAVSNNADVLAQLGWQDLT